MGDANAVATDRDNCPCVESVAMPPEQLGNQGDAPIRRYVREAHQSGMRYSRHVDQLPEVGIDRHQYSGLGGSTFEECPISRIGAKVTSIKHVMTLFAQPLRQQLTGTAIDQKPHEFAIDTASNESCAITACAYAVQARMSSGSNSG